MHISNISEVKNEFIDLIVLKMNILNMFFKSSLLPHVVNSTTSLSFL